MGLLGAVRRHQRSPKLVLFDKAHTNFYERSIVTMSLSCIVSVCKQLHGGSCIKFGLICSRFSELYGFKFTSVCYTLYSKFQHQLRRN